MVLPLKMIFSMVISNADGLSFSLRVPLKFKIDVEHSHLTIPDNCSMTFASVSLDEVLLDVP
jgi:hypothetical protein